MSSHKYGNTGKVIGSSSHNKIITSKVFHFLISDLSIKTWTLAINRRYIRLNVFCLLSAVYITSSVCTPSLLFLLSLSFSFYNCSRVWSNLSAIWGPVFPEDMGKRIIPAMCLSARVPLLMWGLLWLAELTKGDLAVRASRATGVPEERGAALCRAGKTSGSTLSERDRQTRATTEEIMGTPVEGDKTVPFIPRLAGPPCFPQIY